MLWTISAFVGWCCFRCVEMLVEPSKDVCKKEVYADIHVHIVHHTHTIDVIPALGLQTVFYLFTEGR
jgi:hypothetical protein